MLKKLVLAGMLAMPFGAQAAALMGFADSGMLMGEVGRYYQETMLNYSPRLGHALGVEYMRMEGKDDNVSSISTINYTGLIQRWNMKGGQMNLWFSGGLGESHGDDGRGLAYTPGLQFDYETTRLYFLAKAGLVRAPGMNFDTAAIQGGFSFYETAFDQTQPWFVLEARTMRNMSPAFQLTPALRFINKDFFLELGVSSPFDPEHRGPRVNFMFLF